MKTTLIKSLILSSVMFGSLAQARDTLIVWEDIDKGNGIQAVVEKFKAENNCDVILRHNAAYVSHVETYAQNVKSGGETPDVLMLPADRLGDAAKQGYIVPLSFMNFDKNKYIPSSISAFTYNREIYAMPRSVETLVMYYNQDLIKYPYENFEDYVKFSRDQIKQGRYGVIGKWDVFYFIYGFLSGYGAYVFNDLGGGQLDPNDIGLDNEGAVAGLNYVKTIVKDILPKEILGNDGWGKINEYFINGKVAAVITGPWDLDAYAAGGMNYGVAPVGKLPNGQYFCPFLGYRGYAVTATSKKKALAEKFLQYLNKTDNAVARYNEIHEIPPLKEIMSLPQMQNDDFANAVLTQALHAVPMPNIPQMSSVWGPLDSAIPDVLSGKISADKALHETVIKIKSDIAKNHGPKPEPKAEEQKAEEPKADENATEVVDATEEVKEDNADVVINTEEEDERAE